MRVGHMVMTRGISDKAVDDEHFAKELTHYLTMFLRKDWGVVSESDKEMNDQNAENNEGSLLGAYETTQGRIWIMTEHDRSVTTILFPHEY